MAIYGTLGEVDLGALEASISDTAVDIFVYDTRKDSDGGAWRHRTQHTSWYNETLNTATRGARREFPAVAVIVAEADQVTIYDGDDPDLPMWMVFNESSNASAFNLLGYSTRISTAVAALNAEFMFCSTSSQNQTYFNLISDYGFLIYDGGSNVDYYNGNIGQRNDGLHYRAQSVSRVSSGIVNRNVNDVAMTVLPNAPIDSATGLPIPTIAVATDGGASVIKDGGTVANITGFAPNQKVEIDEKYVISTARTAGHDFIYKVKIPSVTSSFGSLISPGVGGGFYTNSGFSGDVAKPVLRNDNTTGLVYSPDNTIIMGGDLGLEIIAEETNINGYITNQSNAESPIAYIASDYNTGWMHGDIKGAFLSDTDATNVTGSGTDLIHGNDSTFDDIIANLNWSERSGSGGAWNVSGGVLKTGTVSSGEYLDITTSGYTSGQTYVISYVLSNVTGSMPLRWRFNNGQMGNLPTSNGPQSYYVTLTETGTLFSLLNDANLTADIDNFKLQLVKEEDRSVNNKGLQVFGTVTKTPVATGAELVSYNSSTDNSGYLQKPLTSSDFDLTSPWSISFWVEKIETGGSGGAYTGIQITEDDLTSNSSYSKIPFSIYLRRDAGDIGFRGTSVTGFTLPDPFTALNVWRCFTTTFDGSGTLKFYMDGIYQYSTPATFVNPSNKYSLQIMSWAFNASYYKNDNYNFSLFKMSNSAPSAEQIKKIYEDEKVLFQENAACTLYGSSDAVTALAYDDSTSLLHVGTSSGRSEFKGLRRVGNTTTAVTTAISASNSLVAEQ